MSSDRVILADADNTLWDTDSVFADAQLKLLAWAERTTNVEFKGADRLAFIRDFDQAIAARHHLHLKYPPQMLAAALAAGLFGVAPHEVAVQVLGGKPLSFEVSESQTAEALDEYRRALSQIPRLLPTVQEGLALARAAKVPVYVMTEGRIEKQQSTISAHGLSEYFASVWELTKNVQQFERIQNRFPRKKIVVIGDQPDRDIVPAHTAGCITVLVPSRFRPLWHTATDYQQADLIASDFMHAMEWAVSAVGTERDQPTNFAQASDSG